MNDVVHQSPTAPPNASTTTKPSPSRPVSARLRDPKTASSAMIPNSQARPLTSRTRSRLVGWRHVLRYTRWSAVVNVVA